MNVAAWRAPRTSPPISRPSTRRRLFWLPPRGSSPTRSITWMCALACSTSSNLPADGSAGGERDRSTAGSHPARAGWRKCAGPHTGRRLCPRQAIVGGGLRSRARRSAGEPLFAWAYTELLHDEARHATFGAKTAAWVIRRWSARQRRALWACVAHRQLGRRGGRAPARRGGGVTGAAAGQLGLHAAAGGSCRTLRRWGCTRPLGSLPANETRLVH